VNAFAIFVVNEHLEYLLAEAAANRAVKVKRPSMRARIAKAVDELMQAAERTYATSSIFPKFEDYHARG
jgi:ethanolamine ammonia-lyase large subunit